MLDRRRKKFPKTDAIYFISPTKRSVQRLVDDFETKDKKGVNEELIHKPQYGAVHLFFTSKVPESLVSMMASSKSLAPRIRSFNEINLDFYFFNDSVFHLGKKNTLPMFRIIRDEMDRGRSQEAVIESSDALAELCTQLANRLFTVCAVFREYPHIQYQADSPVAKALASQVSDMLQDLYQLALS